MAFLRIFYLFRKTSIQSCHFSSSTSVANKWRIQLGLEPNPRQFGPLTNFPDYSYVDGRPRILGLKEKIKKEFQQKLCERIVELNHELDVGLEMYHKRETKKAAAKDQILKNKLRPKGAALKKKTN